MAGKEHADGRARGRTVSLAAGRIEFTAGRCLPRSATALRRRAVALNASEPSVLFAMSVAKYGAGSSVRRAGR